MALMAACSSFAALHVHGHGSNPALATLHGNRFNWKGRRNPSSFKLRVGFAAKAMGSDSKDRARQMEVLYIYGLWFHSSKLQFGGIAE